MADKTRMEVKIRGKYYTIVADEPEEYVYKICAHVDRKVSEICNMNPRLGTEMSSILTAINMADELYKTGMSEDNLRKQIIEYGREISELESKVAQLEAKLKLAENKA